MLNEFKRYLEDDSVSENTIMRYISDVTIFLKFFKDKFGEEIIQLEHIVITEYIKELKNASKYEEQVKVKVYPHVLRDYFCTEAHNKKALTELQIAALAGHSSLNTTRKYVRIRQEDLLEGVNKI